MCENYEEVDVALGDVLVTSQDDGIVAISLNREDALDLYADLARYGNTYISQEVAVLLKRFFCEQQDVWTDPARSPIYF